MTYKKTGFTTALLLSALMCSCHFGDIDDVRPDYGKVNRNISFKYNLNDVPGNDDIALFAGFTGKAMKLSYMPDEEYNYQGNKDLAIANNVKRTTLLVYPYSAVNSIPADTTEIPLDYSIQDGTLANIEQNLCYATAMVEALCDSADVNGLITPIEPIVALHKKHAVLRLNLVDETGTMTLKEKLNKRSIMYGNGFSINGIEVSAADGNLADKVDINPKTGALTRAKRSHLRITLKEAGGHNMINRQTFEIGNNELDSNTNGGLSWGTACYVALPCLGNSESSEYSLNIKVSGTVAGEQFAYYGRLAEKYLFHEGENYISEPIRCFESEDAITEDDHAGVFQTNNKFK